MQSPHLIMLVDSREDDLFLMQRAFRAVGVSNPILAIDNLEGCRNYLQGRGGYSDREKHPLPSVVVLDLAHRPGTAFELLREIRTSPGFKNLPIIAFAPDERGSAVQRAYDLGANAVFTKGLELYSLAKTIRDLEFLEDVLRPKNEGSAENVA